MTPAVDRDALPQRPALERVARGAASRLANLRCIDAVHTNADRFAATCRTHMNAIAVHYIGHDTRPAGLAAFR